MTRVFVPKGLTPMLERAYIALQDWCTADELKERVPGKTPAKVIVSILRARLERFGESVACDAFYKHNTIRKYRIVRMDEERAAA